MPPQVAVSATEYPSPPMTTETEVLTIAAVSYDAASDQSTVTLEAPLSHRHFAGVVDSGGLRWLEAVRRMPY